MKTTTTKDLTYGCYIIPCEKADTHIRSTSICASLTAAVNTILKNNEIGESPKTYSIIVDEKIVNMVLYTVTTGTLRAKYLQLGSVYKACIGTKSAKVAFVADNTPEQFKSFEELEKLFELTYLVNYKFDKFLTKPKTEMLGEVEYFFTETQAKNSEKAMLEAKASANGIYVARDAVNYPTSHMSPQDFAELSIKKGIECGFQTEIIKLEDLKSMGAQALISVGKGSKNPPVMVVMRYNGDPENKQKYAIVGKGVMYDTGGYSLKPGAGMITMHDDMGGGAATLGAMCVTALMKEKINLVAIVPACENTIGDDAIFPGTIIGSLLGRTIEVNSTDAEGRLILADGLTYAWQYEKADVLVDIATLTGAAGMAVGNKSSAGIGTDDVWKVAEKASKTACEKIWRLDLDEELRPIFNSFRADTKNSSVGGSRAGGTIMGALFLSPFTNDLPWLHIDIAPVAWTTEETPIGPKGATGYGVSLLYNMIKQWAK